MNLFVWGFLLAAPAAAAGGAAALPASWDQCFCSQPTDDPFQPYKNVRYGSAPGCGEPWRATAASVWFSCQDALLAGGRTRCFCVRDGTAESERYGKGPECRDLPYPRDVPAAGLLRCSEVPALARTPPGDCYCVGKTGVAAHPREAVRWNWSPACIALPFGGKERGLSSCADASTRIGKCWCRDSSGSPRRRDRRPAACAGIVYVDMEFRAEPGRRQVPLPRCEADAALEASPAAGAE